HLGPDLVNDHQQLADSSENRAQCHGRSLLDAVSDLRDGHNVISLHACLGAPLRLAASSGVERVSGRAATWVPFILAHGGHRAQQAGMGDVPGGWPLPGPPAGGPRRSATVPAATVPGSSGVASLTIRSMPATTRRVLLAKPRGYCAGVDRAVQ